MSKAKKSAQPPKKEYSPVPTAEGPKEGNRKGSSPLPPKTEQGCWETLSGNGGDPSKELALLIALAWTSSCHLPSGWETRQETGHFVLSFRMKRNCIWDLDRETAAYYTEYWSCELDAMHRKAYGLSPCRKERKPNTVTRVLFIKYCCPLPS